MDDESGVTKEEDDVTDTGRDRNQDGDWDDVNAILASG